MLTCMLATHCTTPSCHGLLPIRSYSSYSLADDGLAIPELLVAGLLLVLRELATEEAEETGLRAPVVEELVVVGFLRPVDAAG